MTREGMKDGKGTAIGWVEAEKVVNDDRTKQL